MSQIVIVSNRLPISVKKEHGVLTFFPSVGGLATGLSSYVNDKRNKWIGWPGIASDDLSRSDRQAITRELARHNCLPVFLTQKQIDAFYSGYSNTVLWPLLHTMRAQDKAGATRDEWYRVYQTVNKLFAKNAAIASGRGAHIWVHDYQLLLVPRLLRDMKVDAMIGFFLHVPFPDVKTFRRLVGHDKLLQGVLGADLIGFHTTGYTQAFLQTCEQLGFGKAGDQTLGLGDRVIRVMNFPMGIDYAKYALAGQSKIVRQAVKKYRRQYKGKKLIVAVDRLDPSKGLPERLEAYKQFLDQYPKWRGKVIFAMVAAPSRTDVPAYQRLAKQLDDDVDTINRTYGTDEWRPVDYIHHALPFEEVTALFRLADVAFIAPLRDGMNLAAKEFVASTDKDSVLILSETAGASEELRDALIVNPRRPKEVVAALQQALTMRPIDLRRRLGRMKRYLQDHTIQSWAEEFIDTMQTPLPSVPTRARTLDEEELRDAYRGSAKRLFLLDYDGSLVPFASDYRRASPPKSLLRLMRQLGNDPANDVVLISGRSAANLDKWFGKLPIHLIAEHGASVKLLGGRGWHAHGKRDDSWKDMLLPTLKKYTAETPGATIEVKTHSLVWHYRMAPPYYAQKHLVIIQRTLGPFLKAHGLKFQKGNKVLEIKDPTISKGVAANSWLTRQYDFVFAIGDDTTDEELFAVLPETAYGVKVGRGRTAARYRVKDYRDIRRLLSMFARLS